MKGVRLHLRMAVLLVAALRSLKRRDITETLRHLSARPGPTDDVSPAAALEAIKRPARLLRAPCLAQSAALAVALEQAQRQPALVLGCRRYDDRRWGAHAWVVVGDTVLDALPSGPHQELARLQATTHWVPSPAR